MMQYITDNFAYREFFPNGLKNIDPEIIRNTENLVERVLQPAREILGKPIRITSGYRSPEYNNKIGGAANSRHLCGDACDLYVPDMSGIELWQFFIQNFHGVIGGIGLYFPESEVKFIHVDLRPKVDRKITTWYHNLHNQYVKIPEKYRSLLNVEIKII